MTIALAPLKGLAVLLLAGAVWSAIFWIARDPSSPPYRSWSTYEAYLDRKLRQMFLPTHGRTIIWGLTSDGPAEWHNGWFFDPEDGATYSVSARMDGNDRISARIYRGFALFGRTEILTRVAAHSLTDWCGTDAAR